MKPKYPYRFKTKDEFEKEFGPMWYVGIESGRWIDEMDQYFGIIYPFTQVEINYSRNNRFDKFPNMDSWCRISPDMLTLNKIEPTYEPKEKIVRSL